MATSKHRRAIRDLQSVTTLPALPPQLAAFLLLNGIDPTEYRAASEALTSRFYRINPFPPSGRSVDTAMLAVQLGCAAAPVDWLPPGFFRVPNTTRLACTDAFARGDIYGMDASSAAAVYALELAPGLDVLDLCCAPGTKLCLIADLLGRRGSLTGVDLSRHRLATCAQVLKKYGAAFARAPKPPAAAAVARTTAPFGTGASAGGGGDVVAYGSGSAGEGNTAAAAVVATAAAAPAAPAATAASVAAEARLPLTSEWRCRLIEADGAALALDGRGGVEALDQMHIVLDSQRLAELEPKFRTRRRKNKSWRAREKRAAKRARLEAEAAPPRPPLPLEQYDRVLVDAECTHDGSLKHVAKLLLEDGDGAALVARMLDPKRLRELPALQRRLLRAGFRLLRPGGLLVYSTCSFARAQNETVVADLLESEPSAVEERVPSPVAATPYPARGGEPHGLRFDPLRSGTSGLFIARIRKTA